MAQSQRRLVQSEDAKASRSGKYKLDELDPARIAKHLVMFQPSIAVVEKLVDTARASIPGMAATEQVLKVLRHNPVCVMALARKSKFDPADPQGEGFVAILPLNMLGLQNLALGTFNGAEPDLRLIAEPGERPAGIYMWGVFAPGPLAAGIALFIERMAAPQYAGVSLYSRPNTDAGRKYNEVLGLIEGVQLGALHAPHLWKFPREPQAPLYDSYVRGAARGEIGITVARTFDDLTRVIAIRNAVYIGEQECPYDEEYDGNDLSAAHLLAYIGDEPVGCLRVRFFADFAKFERMAIRKEFRKSRAAIQLTKAGFQFCQKKGYHRIYGHAQKRLEPFWNRLGFHVADGSKPFVFSGFDYVEMIAELERDPDAVKLGTDPYVIIRPEGRWHIPGILEQSAVREVSALSSQKKH
jgi:predicted GNAT family N-acyltransferase